MDVKVERAMLDLSEYKNNFVVEKTSYERQMQQAKKDKESRLRNTHYSGGGFRQTATSFFSSQGQAMGQN